jgi:hypothetical protein
VIPYISERNLLVLGQGPGRSRYDRSYEFESGRIQCKFHPPPKPALFLTLAYKNYPLPSTPISALKMETVFFSEKFVSTSESTQHRDFVQRRMRPILSWMENGYGSGRSRGLCKYLIPASSGETEESHETSITLAGKPTEIRSWYPPNIDAALSL